MNVKMVRRILFVILILPASTVPQSERRQGATKDATAQQIRQESTFNDFVDGTFDDAGANMYVSAKGSIQTVNRIVRNLSGGGVDCVDSYMELENNIIMDNEGGAAVMLRSRFSYFMPSVVRNNILQDNDGGTVNLSDNHGQPPIVENNSVQDRIGSGKNSADSPESMDDTIRGKIQSSLFDPVSFSTRFTIQKSIGKTGDMQGRVVLIGNQWSVIKKSEGKNLEVWGDVSAAPGCEFEVISQYRMIK